MLQHILYIVAPNRFDASLKAIQKMRGEAVVDSQEPGTTFRLRHRLLGDLILEITVLQGVEEVAQRMRHFPVDLLIYDERGNGQSAIEAIHRMQVDLLALESLWGPDFHFPMSRIIAILASEHHSEHDTFVLGRMKVRDVITSPSSDAMVLKWIRRVLQGGVIRSAKVGLAMSGGGIEGALYQAGVVQALERAISGKKLHQVEVVSGVSSGALVGSMVANQIPIEEVIRSVHNVSTSIPTVKSYNIYDFAAAGITKRLLKQMASLRLKPSAMFESVIRSIPTGFFKGMSIEKFYKDMLKAYDRPDAFDQLDTKLYIGATDQDSFEHVVFGTKGRDKVAISEALRASCAFPLIFTPKTILGRSYIDGQVTRSCNLNILVQNGCRLVMVIDPLKPAKTPRAGSTEEKGGIFSAIQVVKALCASRFEANLRNLSNLHPDVDFIIFQPDEVTSEVMSGSPMRAKVRSQIVELAYRGTLRKLAERYEFYQTKLSRFGLHLRSRTELMELESDFDRLLKSG